MPLVPYKVLDPKLDRLSFDETVELQGERLTAQVAYCYENTAFWKKKFDTIGLKPEDIKSLEDLFKIPFCTKVELQQDQEENPPFGSYVASPPSTWKYYFSTSGTTGKPLNRVFSEMEWLCICQKFARDPRLLPGEVVLLCSPVEMNGPRIATDIFRYQGHLVIEAGLYTTQERIEAIKTFHPAVLHGTTSAILKITDAMLKKGMNPKDSCIRIIMMAGEPGAAVEETRKRVAEIWGVEYVEDGYGITEVFHLGISCKYSKMIHIPNDFIITEVIDDELVFTNIIGDTQPLLRYKSGDIGHIEKFGACKCGSTATRLTNGVEGRLDNMVCFRGKNVYLQDINSAVKLGEKAEESRKWKCG